MLGKCCFNGCTKNATTSGSIYGHYKDEMNAGVKDGFITIVACDEHAKRKDFYPRSNKKKS